MTNQRRRLISRIVACTPIAAACALPGLGQAQQPVPGSPAWPQRPVRVVSPFAAGGVLDNMVRAVQIEVANALGQPLILENRPGAGGTVGTASVARAAPDGYTFLIAANSHHINAHLYSKLAYDPVTDFTGVAAIGTTGYVLMIPAALPVKTVDEFVRLMRANPGKYHFASAGVGSATHLSMAYLANLANLDMLHVPMKSTGEAVTEVLAGRAHAVMPANIGAIPFAADPRVRLIGVTSREPTPFLPDLSPISRAVPGYEFDSWLGLLAPATVPRAVLERMHEEMMKALKRPEVQERLAKQGVDPLWLSRDAFNKLLAADFVRMAKVVKAAGAKID